MKITDNEQARRLTHARATLIIDQPFFGALALRLKLIEDFSIPTMAVDGRHVYYNPKFTKTLDNAELKFVVAHEVGHCVFDHIGRRGARNPKKWNMAGDFVINDMLVDAGFTMPKVGLLNPAYKGMSADHIYSLLPEQDDKGPGNGQPGGALCDIMDGAGGGHQADQAETEILSNDWKIATIQAANAAKAEGKLPGALQRFVDSMTDSKVDWRAQLRRFVTERNQDDYSWLRPNRRYLGAGLYLPSLYSEGMGEIAIVVDTSGSIDQPTLEAFGAEINAIRDSVRPAVTRVIYCDARVQHVDTYEPEDTIELAMHGGGGTDFCPPFEHIEEHGHKPKCLVYLTDMYGRFPDNEPEFPVIWCATSDVLGPWGETTRIEL
jgi:predicted metal-dependent peptidase